MQTIGQNRKKKGGGVSGWGRATDGTKGFLLDLQYKGQKRNSSSK